MRVSASDGGLLVKAEIRPEVWAKISEDTPPDQPPFALGFFDADADRYVVTQEPGKGMKGYFLRDDAGQIEGLHLGGRLALKVK
jgi:hypothetical protein